MLSNRPNAEKTTSKTCPLCSNELTAMDDNGYCTCAWCKSIINLGYQRDSYSTDYFTEEYQKQYGKSYEQDFPGIYQSSCRRLDTLLSLTEKAVDQLSVFEAGPAYGYFLKCCFDRGITDLSGVEISSHAVDWCRKNYGFYLSEGSLEDFPIEQSVDIFAAWFVMEHFREPGELFRRIYSVLNPGGIAAFSMPSWRGPLYTFHKRQWLESHPVDHHIDVHPGGLKRFLKHTGFKKVSIISSGFHPERIVNTGNPFFPIVKPLYRVFTRLMPWSDTVEVYAVK